MRVALVTKAFADSSIGGLIALKGTATLEALRGVRP